MTQCLWLGTLEGFSFGSEDEAEDMPKATANQNDQNEGAEERQNAKDNGKAEKKTVCLTKFNIYIYIYYIR